MPIRKAKSKHKSSFELDFLHMTGSKKERDTEYRAGELSQSVHSKINEIPNKVYKSLNKGNSRGVWFEIVRFLPKKLISDVLANLYAVNNWNKACIKAFKEHHEGGNYKKKY